MKVVFTDPKLGRSAQVELKADATAPLINKKIGESIDGSIVGLPGFKMKITGGSDRSGFPMERSIEGTGKVRVFKSIASSGRKKGQFRRINMRGNIISADTEQVNLAIVEYGDKPTAELFPVKEKAAKPAAEAKEEKKPAKAKA